MTASDPTPKRRRLPAISAILLVLTLVAIGRSIWRVDTLRHVQAEDGRQSITITTYGLQTAQLGLQFFYRQDLMPARDVAKVNAAMEAIPPLGWEFVSDALQPEPSLLRWFGFDFRRELDGRPQSFVNVLSVAVPLWLLGALLAIEPVRYGIAIGRERRQRRAQQQADGSNSDRLGQRGGVMRSGIAIGLICGIIIGAAATLLLVRRPATDPAQASAGSAAAGGSSPAAEAPIHPIVGVWQIEISPIIATYTFDNDGRFTLTFRGVPGRQFVPPIEHQAAGTWKVDGDLLKMHNTSSTSGYTVVGEVEEARILSVTPEQLLLENRDRKGRQEMLVFEPVRPFIKGKFDNPALIGIWKSDQQYSLQLKDSGDVVITGGRSESGRWSQEGNRLRLLLDPPPQRPSARRPANAPAPEPVERVYEIASLSPDRNMLLLQPTRPKGAPRVTYYRVN